MLKRIFDIFFSLFGILALIPVFIITGLFIKADSKGPIFFKQKRIGQFGKEFEILKFRSMSINNDSVVKNITYKNDPRITKAGQFLRKYKIDELPQLINVFKGDMSFVGPRPEVKEYVDFYDKDIKDKILSLKPGITDYASIEYVDENNLLDDPEKAHEIYINEILPTKIKYSIKYFNERSFLLDLKLIMKTIILVLK